MQCDHSDACQHIQVTSSLSATWACRVHSIISTAKTMLPRLLNLTVFLSLAFSFTSLASPIGPAVKLVRPFSGDKPQTKLDKNGAPDELIVSSSSDIRVSGTRRHLWGSPGAPAHLGKVVIWEPTHKSGTISVKKAEGEEIYLLPVLDLGNQFETQRCPLHQTDYVWSVTTEENKTVMTLSNQKDGKRVGQIKAFSDAVTGVGFAFTLRRKGGGIDLTIKGD